MTLEGSIMPLCPRIITLYQRGIGTFLTLGFTISSVSSISPSQGRDSETLQDNGTVQMSHSSVTGVRSKSFIRLWISGKYSLKRHLDKS